MMVRKYVKKTARRRREDRELTVRAVHREPPDVQKLCELLIRFTLQDFGDAQARRASQQAHETFKPPPGQSSSA